MAPWSIRRGSQSANQPHGQNAPDTVPSTTPTPTPTPPPTLISTLSASRTSFFSNAHADSSSSDLDYYQQQRPSVSKTPRYRHSRSMSQPFPSLFGGKKKKRQNSTGAPPPPQASTSGLGPTNEDGLAPRRASSRPPPPPPPKTQMRGVGGGGGGGGGTGGPTGSKDFATGNCMTCGSMVRWPQDLKVFKCTICLTVNDLQVFVPDRPDNARPRSRLESSHNLSAGPPTPPTRVSHISVEHSRRLAQQSIHTHLKRKFGPPSPRTSENQPVMQGNPPLGTRMQVPAGALPPNDVVQDTTSGSVSPTIQISHYMFDEEPTLRASPMRTNSGPAARAYSSSYAERPPVQGLLNENAKGHVRLPSRPIEADPRRIFKPLEDYIVACFDSFDCINTSFVTGGHQQRQSMKIANDSTRRKPMQHRESRVETQETREAQTQQNNSAAENGSWELDPKLLLLGDVAENGLWWTGAREETLPSKAPAPRGEPKVHKPTFSAKSPHMNWAELSNWYSVVTNVAEGWFSIYEELCRGDGFQTPSEQELQKVERDLLQAQEHVRRVLLKVTELLLKRPGRPLSSPINLRFLLIIAENPLLHADFRPFLGMLQPDTEALAVRQERHLPKAAPDFGPLSGQHSGITKRIIGLISNSSTECHNQLIAWFAKYHKTRFARWKDLVSGFLTYRILRQSEKKREVQVDITAGLIPQMQEGRSSAYLHDEINVGRTSKKPKDTPKNVNYSEDWQIKACAKVLALVFAANNLPHIRRGDDHSGHGDNHLIGVREGVHDHGQLLPTSDFYVSIIDNIDLVADFENWESRRGKFSFCQYPFLLSIWAKNRILEHDARRQMESKARDAFFDSIMSRRAVNQFLVLDVRRDCLVDDSLKAVSEVIGSGSEDIKKGLRIIFKGEEGVDGGGLRKEWFLLLVREVFNPDHGLFLYDEDSQYCYFNPNSFETSDQFFLVGVVMGLAIYNSTILDVALPPFAFRKLIASAPTQGAGASAHPRPPMRYTLEDLAEYRPRLSRGLRQLLEYDGDVEETFSLDFVIETEKYGTAVHVPLCPNGERIAVTSSNRREYVDLYIRYVLDLAVARQFEPFKRGFYTVCGGNALSLLRPEEIELLVRGSEEALDIQALKAVAEYDNWGTKRPEDTVPVISWFWETFEEATPQDQRKLLLFITGSDRIPAMGAAALPIKISCLGDDGGRFPSARTCFNMLSLARYESKEKLEKVLWTAVHESEGFGLK